MPDTLDGLLTTYPALAICRDSILAAYDLLHTTYAGGGKVLLCGNGGSAADCEHIVGELMKGYQSPRPLDRTVRAQLVAAFPDEGNYLADHLQGVLPAISLVSQTALITAFANDVAADMVFAQQVYGYGRPGDTLIAISTSGNSTNVVNAVRVARTCGLRTLGFTGQSGGLLKRLCDVTVCVPAARTAAIQEFHLPIYHALCELLEDAFFA